VRLIPAADLDPVSLEPELLVGWRQNCAGAMGAWSDVSAWPRARSATSSAGARGDDDVPLRLGVLAGEPTEASLPVAASLLAEEAS